MIRPSYGDACGPGGVFSFTWERANPAFCGSSSGRAQTRQLVERQHAQLNQNKYNQRGLVHCLLSVRWMRQFCDLGGTLKCESTCRSFHAANEAMVRRPLDCFGAHGASLTPPFHHHAPNPYAPSITRHCRSTALSSPTRLAPHRSRTFPQPTEPNDAAVFMELAWLLARSRLP